HGQDEDSRWWEGCARSGWASWVIAAASLTSCKPTSGFARYEAPVCSSKLRSTLACKPTSGFARYGASVCSSKLRSTEGWGVVSGVEGFFPVDQREFVPGELMLARAEVFFLLA